MEGPEVEAESAEADMAGWVVREDDEEIEEEVAMQVSAEEQVEEDGAKEHVEDDEVEGQVEEDESEDDEEDVPGVQGDCSIRPKALFLAATACSRSLIWRCIVPSVVMALSNLTA